MRHRDVWPPSGVMSLQDVGYKATSSSTPEGSPSPVQTRDEWGMGQGWPAQGFPKGAEQDSLRAMWEAGQGNRERCDARFTDS